MIFKAKLNRFKQFSGTESFCIHALYEYGACTSESPITQSMPMKKSNVIYRPSWIRTINKSNVAEVKRVKEHA